MLQAFRKLQILMSADLMGRLKAGQVTARNLEGLKRSRFKREGQAVERLDPMLRRIGRTGGKQVVEEIERGST